MRATAPSDPDVRRLDGNPRRHPPCCFEQIDDTREAESGPGSHVIAAVTEVFYLLLGRFTFVRNHGRDRGGSLHLRVHLSGKRPS